MSIRVIDLFAGLGGMSQGAIAAGANVIEVYDNDPVPLKLLAANVPGVKAVLATLGPGGDAIELPPAAPDLHVHASSPCTELSPAKYNATQTDVATGVGMLQWALDLVLARGDYSWSLENVSTPTTRKVLADYKRRFPGEVDFATLDASDFGAPQTRIRLIAAPPRLIKLLQQMPSARRVSVREAFSAAGLEVVAEAFKNQTRNRDGTPCLRSVEEQSFTVCASHALTWCTREGKTLRVMNAKESAVLMGFTPNWRLPTGSRTGQRAVGNALCVAMSKAIAQAAIAIYTDEPVPLPPPTAIPPVTPSMPAAPPEPTPTVMSAVTVQDPDTTAHTTPHDSRKICKHLKSIEALLRGLHEPQLAR
jgi:site-specific DNA-cytosine methylase